ncbi:hypothetical protein PRK78_002405 [Emydomyces testavorans]|uniref:Uncharacterized protein n=1 Tax=Emydomyces testavorans TaxID=2070801 RepID=A0AAF0DG41_9EURO|nr:hypothetical protein PRK78_002405 [Emydomyces testavorans]
MEGQKECLTFVHTTLEIFEVSELLIGRQSTLQTCHLPPQLGPDRWMLGQHEEHIAQQAGGRIATGQQNVHELVQNAALVGCAPCQCMREDIFLALCVETSFLFRFRFGLNRVDRLVDKLLRELPADAIAFVSFPVAYAPHRDGLLGIVECLSEIELRWGLLQAADGLSKEELGGRIDRVAEEEILQVYDRLSVARNQCEEPRDQVFKQRQVRDLVAGEVGSDEGARHGPVVAISIEDAFPEEGF